MTTPKNAGKPWSKENDEHLILCFSTATQLRLLEYGWYEGLAAVFGRTPWAVYCRLKTPGVRVQLKKNLIPSWDNIKNKPKFNDFNETTISTATTPTQQENTMSTNPFKNARVTRQVFIGDRKAKNLSIEELISMIETEAKRSNHLTNLQIESDAIQKLIDQHEQNIADLSTILTERLKEEQDA